MVARPEDLPEEIDELRVALLAERARAARRVLVAAVLRVVVPPERCGLLKLRSRPVDVALYGGLGAAIVAVAVTITGGPFG